MTRKVVITAENEELDRLHDLIKSDSGIQEELSNDASGTLKRFGLEVDDDTARAVEQHFAKALRGEVRPEAAVVAVAVAIAIAVAI